MLQTERKTEMGVLKLFLRYGRSGIHLNLQLLITAIRTLLLNVEVVRMLRSVM